MSASPQTDNFEVIANIIAQGGEPAVMPQVVYKIGEMTRSDDASAEDLEREIAVDPGFSAKVLGMSNSAAFAVPKEVTSIREAVMFLGFDQVRRIAMQAGVFDFFVGKTDADSLRRRSWWKHALDTAMTARLLARQFNAAAQDEAYTVGLFHSLGRTMLCRADVEAYNKVEFLISKGAPDWQAEEAIYGAHHVDVVMAAGHAWGFPAMTVFGLDYIRPAEPDDPSSNLRSILAIGEGCARLAMNAGEQTAAEELKLPEWALRNLGIAPAMGPTLAATLLAELATSKNSR